MSLRQRVVVITGRSEGGIGFAVSDEYVSKGCMVYATARRVEAMDARCSPERLRMDVTDDTSVREAVDYIIEKEGRIDILVNNVGMTCSGAVIDVDIDRIRLTLETNVHGMVRTSRAIILHIAARKGGTIVNIGLFLGKFPTPFNGIYSASKAAISDSLYLECRPVNISVVLVPSGAAKFKISKSMSDNQGVPLTTLYVDYLDVLQELFKTNRTDVGMPLPQYARDLVAKTLTTNPSRYITADSGAMIIRLLKLLPKRVLVRLLWSQLVAKRRAELAKAK